MIAMLAESPEWEWDLLFCMFLIGIGLILAPFVGRWADARARLIAGWAKYERLSYHRRRHQIPERFAFRALSRGSHQHQYARNRVSGNYHGWMIEAFDYTYNASAFNQIVTRTSTRHLGAVIVQSPVPLAPLYIRPQGSFDGLGKMVGIEDIDFELAAFNQRFFVQASDKKWAFDVIHQDTMELLMDYGSDFSIEFNGYGAIIWRDQWMDPDEYRHALALLTGVLSRLPEYVIQRRVTPEFL